MERGDDKPAVVNKPARIGGMFDERFAGDVEPIQGRRALPPLHDFYWPWLFLTQGSHRVDAHLKAELYGRLGTYAPNTNGPEIVSPAG